MNALLVPLVLAAAGLAVLPEPRRLPRSPAPSADARTPLSPPLLSPPLRRAAVVAVGVLAVSLLLGLWPWWLGIVVATGSGVLAGRLPSRRSSATRAFDRHRLAVQADLLAACLDAGMSVGAALLAVRVEEVQSVSRSPGGPDDPFRALDAVAALLMLGADADTAWRSAQMHPELASLAAAARRSAAGGAGLADAVREHAINLRAAAADAAERSAGRAGVAMTAPLGVCFLPAFLCLGLAPVVVGLLSTLHLF